MVRRGIDGQAAVFFSSGIGVPCVVAGAVPGNSHCLDIGKTLAVDEGFVDIVAIEVDEEADSHAGRALSGLLSAIDVVATIVEEDAHTQMGIALADSQRLIVVVSPAEVKMHAHPEAT